MNKTLILVVEDDKPVQNLMTTTLKAHDYRYLTAMNGETAILEASSHNPDIILLDLGLPDMDGIEVIRKIRTWSNVPIIIISARSEDTDKVEALDAGADDYLTKPFSVEELLARLRVTERRMAASQTEPVSSFVFVNGKLRIDYSAGCAFLEDEELHLTPIEYKLLCLLAKNLGKVLTHTYITQNIWGHSWENDVASLRVFIAGTPPTVHDTSSAIFTNVREVEDKGLEAPIYIVGEERKVLTLIVTETHGCSIPCTWLEWFLTTARSTIDIESFERVGNYITLYGEVSCNNSTVGTESCQSDSMLTKLHLLSGVVIKEILTTNSPLRIHRSSGVASDYISILAVGILVNCYR